MTTILVEDHALSDRLLGGVNKTTTLTWANALIWSNNLASGSCGLTDGSTAGQWRLPNRRELLSLIDDGRYNPALPSGHPFTGVQSYGYWTSTTYAGGTSVAWGVYLYDGHVFNDDKSSSHYVWPVRGGQ